MHLNDVYSNLRMIIPRSIFINVFLEVRGRNGQKEEPPQGWKDIEWDWQRN